MKFEEYVVDLNADCKCGCMEGDRFHKIFRFPNGYGASVVNNPKLKGFSNEGYRILPIRFTGEEDFVTVILPDFEQKDLDCGSWKEAVDSLTRIKDIRV